jgi:carbon-monoxide dehydrogenase small subunit
MAAETEPWAVSLVVNGEERSGNVEPRRLLVHFLREDLGLTGTHVGCDTGQCGACTVLVDGLAVKSCMVLTVQVDGSDVTTVEGLSRGGQLDPLQEAFWEEHGLQCGFCTPGMLMTAKAFLAEVPEPTEEDIRRGLAGVLCRCTGYGGIVRAVTRAARHQQAVTAVSGEEGEP